MGRPNCTRTLAYSTALLSTRWAPPTCSAASAATATCIVVSRPSLAAPSTPTRAAGALSNTMRLCLRVWSIVASASRATPVASPRTAKSESPLSVMAGTKIIEATLPSVT